VSMRTTNILKGLERTWLRGIFLLFAIACSGSVKAVNLNYDNLSSLEEPIATQLGEITFSLSGLVDAAILVPDDVSNQAGNDSFLVGNFQVQAETQLANSWTLGAAYFGSVDTADSADESYTENIALFISGVWGTLAVGDVTGTARELTRRRRGTGNGLLFFADELGTLESLGVSYITRFGPSRWMVTADEEGNYEMAGTYQRPMGNKDYRFSLRWQNTEFLTSTQSQAIQSQSLTVVAELTYGSTVLDAGFGVEQLAVSQAEVDRVYLNVGFARKWGAWTSSAEVHVAETDAQSETSVALGLRYEIARGLSANIGINSGDATVSFADIELLESDDTQGTFSIRYSF